MLKERLSVLDRISGLLSLCSVHLCLMFCLQSVGRPSNGQHGLISCKGKACVHSSYYKTETCCLFQENTLGNCTGHQNRCKVLQSVSLNKLSLKLISQKQRNKWSANIVSTSQTYLLLLTSLQLANPVTTARSQTLLSLLSFNLRRSGAHVPPPDVLQLVKASEAPLTSTKIL